MICENQTTVQGLLRHILLWAPCLKKGLISPNLLWNVNMYFMTLVPDMVLMPGGILPYSLRMSKNSSVYVPTPFSLLLLASFARWTSNIGNGCECARYILNRTKMNIRNPHVEGRWNWSRWDLDPAKMGGKNNIMCGKTDPLHGDFWYSFYMSCKRKLKPHY